MAVEKKQDPVQVLKLKFEALFGLVAYPKALDCCWVLQKGLFEGSGILQWARVLWRGHDSGKESKWTMSHRSIPSHGFLQAFRLNPYRHGHI